MIISVTLVVVTVPEGLPLAVTLALAFATKRMTAERLLVRILGSCETMANASVVCTDKTGTLTQNVMSVVAGSIGIHAKFVRNLKDNKARTNAPDQNQDQPQEQDVTEATDKPQVNRKHADDFSIEQGNINTILPPQLKHLINQSIAIDSTASEDINPETKELAFVRSKTETTLLQFAKDLDWENWKETRDLAKIIQMIPFSSDRKAIGIVVCLSFGPYRSFLKCSVQGDWVRPITRGGFDTFCTPNPRLGNKDCRSTSYHAIPYLGTKIVVVHRITPSHLLSSEKYHPTRCPPRTLRWRLGMGRPRATRWTLLHLHAS